MQLTWKYLIFKSFRTYLHCHVLLLHFIQIWYDRNVPVVVIRDPGSVVELVTLDVRGGGDADALGRLGAL